jgi:hypothetical protein
MDNRLLYQKLFGIPIFIQLKLEELISTFENIKDVYLPYSFMKESMLGSEIYGERGISPKIDY